MTSDHLRRPHEWGRDADCPACRERCYCDPHLGDAGECVHCRLRRLGREPRPVGVNR